jgi:flagellar biogenesis protein FliO
MTVMDKNQHTHEQSSWTLGMVQRAQAWLRGHRVAVHRMRHIETLPLGAKRSLYLVECDGDQFLIAAGDGISAPVLVKSNCGMNGLVPARQEAPR